MDSPERERRLRSSAFIQMASLPKVAFLLLLWAMTIVSTERLRNPYLQRCAPRNLSIYRSIFSYPPPMMYFTYTDVLVYSGSPPAKHAQYILLNRLNLRFTKLKKTSIYGLNTLLKHAVEHLMSVWEFKNDEGLKRNTLSSCVCVSAARHSKFFLSAVEVFAFVV